MPFIPLTPMIPNLNVYNTNDPAQLSFKSQIHAQDGMIKFQTTPSPGAPGALFDPTAFQYQFDHQVSIGDKLQVTSGGASIMGNTDITGPLNVSGLVTAASALNVTSGDLNVMSGDLYGSTMHMPNINPLGMTTLGQPGDNAVRLKAFGGAVLGEIGVTDGPLFDTVHIYGNLTVSGTINGGSPVPVIPDVGVYDIIFTDPVTGLPSGGSDTLASVISNILARLSAIGA
jgi:hypothetical protein